jgi:hypothetical protein
MACNLDILLIDSITDFECIADVAIHCDIDKLCPFIREAQETLLANKIGWGLLQDVIDNKDEESYQGLLCGSVFDYCNKKQKHFGLKRVLAHYAYGLYKYGGSYVDSSYGTVYKVVEDSTPVDEKILSRLKTQHFNLAEEYWKYVEKYLCAKKTTFTEFDDCNCACECGNCNDLGIGNARKLKVRTFKKYNSINNQTLIQATSCGCTTEEEILGIGVMIVEDTNIIG